MINLTRELADIQSTYIPLPDSGCESRYTLKEGLLVIPILGDPEDAPVVVRVHSPYTVRSSGFNYTKGGAPPLVPAPGNTRTGHIFLGGSIGVPAPGAAGDGTMTFRASGMYNFVLPAHATIDGKLMFDAHPYPSGIDMLQSYNRPTGDNPLSGSGITDDELGNYYNSWQSQYFDLGILSSFRILG